MSIALSLLKPLDLLDLPESVFSPYCFHLPSPPKTHPTTSYSFVRERGIKNSQDRIECIGVAQDCPFLLAICNPTPFKLFVTIHSYTPITCIDTGVPGNLACMCRSQLLYTLTCTGCHRIPVLAVHPWIHNFSLSSFSSALHPSLHSNFEYLISHPDYAAASTASTLGASFA